MSDYFSERLATRLTFFNFGFAMSAWAPIVPLTKARLGLDDGELGFLLLCFGMGSMVALPLSGAACGRFGVRATILVASFVLFVVFPMLVLVANPLTLSIVLFFFGASIGAIDGVVNIQAIQVERLCARKMMSGFHALFSIGSICGPAIVAAMLTYGLSLPAIAAVAVAVIALVTAASFPGLITGSLDSNGALFAIPRGQVLAISLFCFTVFLIEGAMLDWSAVFLTSEKSIEPASAGLGYTSFAIAMTFGRLSGDYWVRLLGARRLVLCGAIASATALFMATITPDWPTTLGCYFVVGLGVSNLAPIFFSAAGDQKKMPEHLAVAAIASIGYSGILVGPAIIGFVSHASGLKSSFILLAILMATVTMSRLALPAIRS
ncbi:MFS transporter [Agrobacterium larrymoorei]|uniref:MFS transporter n=1 Tax=Agrobacterium larrymoorei TaxID=160699 RepID=A0A4D7DVJ8_9HYPH|nr:MFS transporter [Agrobacterium larrymoorei]QCJ01102.1 MFS transporter [Agrobacterium larrymoorei]QYA10116.1 MFS transporter [Agrobacterium larrymoorei]